MSTGEEELREAAAETDRLQKALLAAARGWATSQAEYVRRFLLEEGKLTVVKQSAVTESIPEKVAAIRTETEQIADDAARAVLHWAGSLTFEAAITMAPDPSKQFRVLTSASQERFGALFESNGYEPDDSRVSREWGNDRPWHFYNPATGTSRSGFIPMEAKSTTELTTAWRDYMTSSRVVTELETALRERRATALWGE